ncbi:MAG: DUF2235 domain-containing protein [Gammaproteobacteria bacterium]|nr:DUF2235 domain-containing protein [Gammaproteobacteria bacterium]
MTGKRIVLCLDGTWNNTYAKGERYDGSKVVKPSNVLKLARAILPESGDQKAQVVYYDTGVGAMSVFPGPSNRMLQFCDKILGGGWGAGFESNIEDSVTFLAHNYQEGDQVYIFGFSRGAATARGLTQFIEWMEGIPGKSDAYYIPLLLRHYVESKGQLSVDDVISEINNDGDKKKQKLAPFKKITIEFLGVWDTVMALGSKLFTTAHRRFHVSDVPASCIKHVRQALSIDEKRADFQPEVWKSADNDEQSLIQLWFAGVHSNIGGGYAYDGLANIPLRWIISQASKCGLEVDETFLKFYKRYPQDKLTESKSLQYKIMDGIRFRNGTRSLLGYPETANLDLHYSVITRIKSEPDELKKGSNEKKHPRLVRYEPNNVYEFLATKDNLNDYLNQISLRDRTIKTTMKLPQKALDTINNLKN